MKHLWPIAFAILTTACSTPQQPIDFTFAEFEIVEAVVTYPEELPKIRNLECYPAGEGTYCEIAGYTSTADIDALEVYKIRSESNTTIAEQNAIALDATLKKANAIVLAGRSQENITKILQEQLEFEIQQRQREKWYYRGLLVLAGGAMIILAD